MKKIVIFSFFTLLFAWVNFFSFIGACIAYTVTIVFTFRKYKNLPFKKKLMVSLFIFVLTFIDYTIIEMAYRKVGPAGMIVFYFIGIQALIIVSYLLRPFIWLPIVGGTIASFIFYSS
ncbi:hypothetical protein [Effusibacillus consociatus]|uniref:Uncharacterized protein n=1 Tax=Effusibacillus consociatus TaxID=1117041 RepID=A0ABV9Q078_9BACL